MSQMINGNYSSIEQMSNLFPGSKPISQKSGINENAKSFLEVLESIQKSDLIFSKHANERLQSRKIDLSETQLQRLENGTRKAGEKGIRESLVMVDNLAFIVNIKNNTVITAVNDSEDKVFTNIDGAVIA